jgi:hypothetical protein
MKKQAFHKVMQEHCERYYKHLTLNDVHFDIPSIKEPPYFRQKLPLIKSADELVISLRHPSEWGDKCNSILEKFIEKIDDYEEMPQDYKDNFLQSVRVLRGELLISEEEIENAEKIQEYYIDVIHSIIFPFLVEDFERLKKEKFETKTL